MSDGNSTIHRLMNAIEASKAGIETPDFNVQYCDWCGSELEPLGMIGFNGSFQWITHRPCSCDGVKAEIEAEAERQAKIEYAKNIEAIKRCGVKRRFLDAEVYHPQVIKYLEAFSSYPGKGLYITGPSRIGKTYLASGIAKAFCLNGYRTTLTTSLAMLDCIKQSFDGNSNMSASKYSCVDILIIDDLGKENANSWVMTTLFQIINERYESVLPTIITTQYPPDELKKRMSRSGERESAVAIVERLRETSEVLFLKDCNHVHFKK